MSSYDNDPRVSTSVGGFTVFTAGNPAIGYSTADEAIASLVGDPRTTFRDQAAAAVICDRCRKPESQQDPVVMVGQYRLHRSHLAQPRRKS